MSQKKKTKLQTSNSIFAAKRQVLTAQAKQHEQALKQQVKSIIPTLAVLGASALAYGLLYRYVSRKEILQETPESSLASKAVEAASETKPVLSWGQQIQGIAVKFLVDLAKDLIRDLVQGVSKREEEDDERS